MNIALSPLNMSPNNYMAKMKKTKLQDKDKDKSEKLVPDIVILDQQEGVVDEKDQKLKIKSQQQFMTVKVESPKHFGKMESKVSVNRDNSFKKKTKDRLIEMLWQEGDADEDSFIFKDEGESSINDTIQTIVSPTEKAKQKKIRMIDELRHQDQKFDRVKDPLDTTTANFMNVLHDGKTKSPKRIDHI